MEYTGLRVINSAVITAASKLITIAKGDKFVDNKDKGKSIFSATKRSGTAGVKSAASIRIDSGDISTYTAKTIRLDIKYRLDSYSHEAQDARDNIKPGKDDFSQSFSTVSQGTFADAAALGSFMVKAINKGFNVSGNPRFVASNKAANTAANNLVTITALDPHIVIEELSISTIESGAPVVRKFTDKNTKVSDSDVFYVNQIGAFGTEDYINANLRIITDASVRPYALNTDERPIQGKLYTQYTIHYDAVRDDVSTGFPLGGISTSRTTHVYYVNEDFTSAWDSAFATAGVTLTDITR